MEGKLYEVEMKFDENVLTEEELDAYLKERFDEEVFIRDGYRIVALFYVPYDKYTDYADELSISIGDVLRGGEYGVCIDYFEVCME